MSIIYYSLIIGNFFISNVTEIWIYLFWWFIGSTSSFKTNSSYGDISDELYTVFSLSSLHDMQAIFVPLTVFVGTFFLLLNF